MRGESVSKKKHCCLPRPIVFVHVPRCAGTSIVEAIRSECNVSNAGRIDPIRVRKAAELILGADDPDAFFTAYPALQQYLLAYILKEGYSVVSGHLPAGTSLLEEFTHAHTFMTVLRDPVDRWISHYIFNKLTNDDPLVQPTRGSMSAKVKGGRAMLRS